MVEAEALRLALRGPVGAGGLKHRVGADDIGFHEGGGAVDGTVDMAFGGQMHDRVGPVPVKDRIHRRAVADIGLLERIAGGVRDLGHIGQRSGIGQLVEVDDRMPGPDRAADHGRSDEARAACDEKLHAVTS